MEHPILFTGDDVRSIDGNGLPTTGFDGNETANIANKEE
jgi:hypothetical protein